MGKMVDNFWAFAGFYIFILACGAVVGLCFGFMDMFEWLDNTFFRLVLPGIFIVIIAGFAIALQPGFLRVTRSGDKLLVHTDPTDDEPLFVLPMQEFDHYEIVKGALLRKKLVIYRKSQEGLRKSPGLKMGYFPKEKQLVALLDSFAA